MKPACFQWVPSCRTRGKGHKEKHKSFSLDRNRFYTVRVTEHSHRLPRTLVESPSFEKLKRYLHMVFGKQLISLPRHSKACLISEKEEPMNKNKSALIIWSSAHISSSKGRYAQTHRFSHYCGTQEHKENNLQYFIAIKITSWFF